MVVEVIKIDWCHRLSRGYGHSMQMRSSLKIQNLAANCQIAIDAVTRLTQENNDLRCENARLSRKHVHHFFVA